MIRVSFCCNDENGHETGTVMGINFEDSRGFHAQLGGQILRFVQQPSRVKVGRRFFAIEPGSARYGWGNWSWDSAQMSQAEAIRLLQYALSRRFTTEAWSVEGPFAGSILAAEARHA